MKDCLASKRQSWDSNLHLCGLNPMLLTTARCHFPTNIETPWPNLRGQSHEICRGLLASLSHHPHPVPNGSSYTQLRSSRSFLWRLSEPRNKEPFSNTFKRRIKVSSQPDNYILNSSLHPWEMCTEEYSLNHLTLK